MDVLENTLINLRVLQSLQCHSRLDTTRPLFKIHTPIHWIPTWIKRWWASQTRTTDISRIQNLYTQAGRLMAENHAESDRLRDYLDRSRRGLQNLKTTYMSDPTIVARIDVILDSVSQILGPAPPASPDETSLV